MSLHCTTDLLQVVWHHAGPYDAAAPSRNQNQPKTKAPMRAFDPAAAAAQLKEQQQQQQQQQQQALQIQKPAPEAPPMPRSNTTISLATPPLPPAKDTNDGPTRRAQAALDKKPTNRRTSGGGLTGQYSTSMPTSGGYFPNMDDATDEAEMARRDRQKQRDEKRRALKAAWGIDTRTSLLREMH